VDSNLTASFTGYLHHHRYIANDSHCAKSEQSGLVGPVHEQLLLSSAGIETIDLFQPRDA
jgi:hypothetical protein